MLMLFFLRKIKKTCFTSFVKTPPRSYVSLFAILLDIEMSYSNIINFRKRQSCPQL